MEIIKEKSWGNNTFNHDNQKNNYASRSPSDNEATWRLDSHLDNYWERGKPTWKIDPDLIRCLTNQNQPDLSNLRRAAQIGDGAAFLKAYKELSTDVITANNLIQVIRLALETGAILLARDISVQGVKQFPDHSELSKYSRVLAPPKTIEKKNLPVLNQEANRQWLKENGARYYGQWVALRDGVLIGAAEKPVELKLLITDPENTFLTIAR